MSTAPNAHAQDLDETDAMTETARLVSALDEEVGRLPASPLRHQLRNLAEHLLDPNPVIGIAGRLNTGKSTLSNGITGGAAATAPTECTTEPRQYQRENGAFRCTTTDTPGTDSDASRSDAALAGLVNADTVAYVVVTPTRRDLVFLEKLYQTRTFSPVNVVVVMNRIDERVSVGSDPWEAAADAVASHRWAPELRALAWFPTVALLAQAGARASLSEDDLSDLREGRQTGRLTRLIGNYGLSRFTVDPPGDLTVANRRLAELSGVEALLDELRERCRERPVLRLLNAVRRLEHLVDSTVASSRFEEEAIARLDLHLTRLRRTSPYLLLHDVRRSELVLTDLPGAHATQALAAYREAVALLRSGASLHAVAQAASPLDGPAHSSDEPIAAPSSLLRHHLGLLVHKEISR
ncbi:GTPase domain-containing protein [Frankia sp. CiP3]|uniref:GTPase domain-containing protein n=1 Tax=Frankia sp. CiP3 TaxID=2880971 RepID=UPI001EF3E350|nr:GTPase domain-containing protein [Frankia sp. CiP3]